MQRINEKEIISLDSIETKLCKNWTNNVKIDKIKILIILNTDAVRCYAFK